MGALLRRWGYGRSMMLAAALLATLLAGVFLLLPLAVSSDVVRDRLERDIGNWAGHRVSLGDGPKLSFWPVPRIQLDNVEILPQVYADAAPIMRADSIVADFSLISAALGSPNFSDFRLVRPTFNLELYPDGTSNWTSDKGELIAGINAAVAADEAKKANQSNLVAASIPESAAIGSVTMVDGTLNWVRDPGAPAEKLSAINGTITWPTPGSVAHTDVTAILRGEQLKISAETSAPLLLIGQRRAPLMLSVTSSPLNIRFQGDANLALQGFANGKLHLDSPSVRRVLEWAGTDIRPGQALGKLELDAQLSTSEETAKLDDLILLVDENRGIGVLDLTFPSTAPPMVAGTLAFNSLNVTSFLQAFTPLPTNGDEIASTIDTRFLRELGLDLRLSAQSAKFGPINMSNLAAAARVSEGRATFDLGDATAYGGSLIGRIAISEAGVDGGANLQLSAKSMDFGSLYDALGLKGPLPRATGSLDMELTTPYPTWATAGNDVTGKFTLSMGAGTISGLDLAELRKLAATKRFFRLNDIAGGSGFAFKSANFSASLSNGQAEIVQSQFIGEQDMISLGGVIPYTRGSLAMAGVLEPATMAEPVTSGIANPAPQTAPKPAQTSDVKPLRFFLGGSWPEPVISPIEEEN